jgi:hypothetical protein
MAAPTYQAKGTIGETTTDSVSFTYMATAANDLLFLVVVDIGDSQTYTVDSSWTEINNRLVIGYSGVTSYLYYKIATGSESGSENISRYPGGGGTLMAAQVYSYRGTSYLTLESSNDSAGFGNTIIWGGLSISGSERTLSNIVINSLGPNPFTASGYTNINNDVLSDGTYFEISTKENVSSAGSVTATNGSSDGWIAFSASLYNNTPAATAARTYIVN